MELRSQIHSIPRNPNIIKFFRYAKLGENAGYGIDKMLAWERLTKETLDGIMIATTNLQQNLDKAFERRFLYKIKFEKPTEEARASIWHTMIPELGDLDVHTLASKYDFSGGQIENIARHYAIDSILHGTNDDVLAMLIRHCDNERLDENNSRKIGF